MTVDIRTLSFTRHKRFERIGFFQRLPTKSYIYILSRERIKPTKTPRNTFKPEKESRKLVLKISDGFGGGYISSSDFLLSSSWIRLLFPRQNSRPSWDSNKSSGVRCSCPTSRCNHLCRLLSAVVSSRQARQFTQRLIFQLPISIGRWFCLIYCELLYLFFFSTVLENMFLSWFVYISYVN